MPRLRGGRNVVPDGFSTASGRRKFVFHRDARHGFKRGVSRQCCRRAIRVLSGDNRVVDRQAARRGNEYFRLGCVSICIGPWSCPRDPWCKTGNRQSCATAGVPVGMIFFLGSVALLAAAGDLRLLVRGGIFGRQRIVRHLWRMCFSFFIATGSFFIGQLQVFPVFIRRTNLLFIPGILPLVLMIFWLIRVRFTKAYKSKSVPSSGNVRSLTA